MQVEPTFDAAQVRHMNDVSRMIAREVAAAGGWISFERYMELVLYAPGLGYYSAGAEKFGRDGDFITSPEVSELFGACVARQCAQVLAELQGGSILELGAGTGRLAVDVLTRLEDMGSLPARYSILEISADLRDRQRRLIGERIPHLRERVQWIDVPPVSPFDGLILANEVMDALPVARFRWHDAGCEELGVATPRGLPEWAARAGGAALQETCRGLAAGAGGWEDGYVSEYCPRLGEWAATMVRALRRGAVLWFDYGLPRAQYYLAERHEGTLICHLRHRAHANPFLYPGLQDISAWVDFTAAAEACDAAGCTLAGFTTQAHFLAGLGIDREMHRLANGDDGCFARLATQAKRLMLPGEMGEVFKAMAWTRRMPGPLSGFVLKDLRTSL